MSDPESVIARTLDTLEAFIADEEPDRRAHPDLQGDLHRYTTRLLTGQPVGD